jgi:hypothetical protein
MVAATKANDWVDYMVEDVDLASDQLVLVLSNTAPASEGSNPLSDGNGVVANITQVAYTYASTRNLTTASSSQTSGTYKCVVNDLTLTATGGAIGPFRYAYIIDDTVAGDPVIASWDYGSSVTINNGEDILFDFSATNGLIQVA